MTRAKISFHAWLCVATVWGSLALSRPALAQANPLEQVSSRLAPLNLTPDQQSRLGSLVAAESPKFKPLRRALRQAEASFLRADPADSQAVDGSAQQIGDAVKAMAMEIGSFRAGLAQILTPAQQSQLQSLKMQAVYRKLLNGGGGGGGGAAQADDAGND